MYVYHDQGTIDVHAVIESAGRLAQLYSQRADYLALKELTDFIDGQTVEHVRSCLADKREYTF